MAFIIALNYPNRPVKYVQNEVTSMASNCSVFNVFHGLINESRITFELGRCLLGSRRDFSAIKAFSRRETAYAAADLRFFVLFEA